MPLNGATTEAQAHFFKMVLLTKQVIGIAGLVTDLPLTRQGVLEFIKTLILYSLIH